MRGDGNRLPGVKKASPYYDPDRTSKYSAYGGWSFGVLAVWGLRDFRAKITRARNPQLRTPDPKLTTSRKLQVGGIRQSYCR